MLEIKELNTSVGSFSVENVNLLIYPHEVHVILGPTGSGKTVLAESILGINDISSGHITLNGVEVENLPIEKRKISYVPQDLSLFPHLSARENILYSLRFNKKDAEQRLKLFDSIIEYLKIDYILDRSPQKLSGGEKQRVALARSIVSGAELLILDEPFSALNESIKKDLWLMLKNIVHKYDMSVLMITHDLSEAFFMGDVISVIIDGKIKQTSTKKSIYYSPKTRKVAELLGVKNIFNGQKVNSGDQLIINCEELGIPVELQNPNRQEFQESDQVLFGIRSNEVMILKQDQDPSAKENILTGIVFQIYERGTYTTVMFELSGNGRVLEIELNDHVYRKLKIQIGMKIQVSLKKENLFIMEEDE